MSTTATEQATKAEAARAALDTLEERRAALLAKLDTPAELVTKLGEPPTVTDAHQATWAEAQVLTRWIEATTPKVERLENAAADARERENKRRAEAQREEWEKQRAETRMQGVAFLEPRLGVTPTELSELLAEAEAEGVSRDALRAGASELGLRQYTRHKIGGSYWGLPGRGGWGGFKSTGESARL